MRRLLLLIALLGLVGLSTGCWDQRDIEKRTFVSAIGVDKGEDDDYVVSIQVPIPNQIAGSASTGGGGGGEAYRVFSSIGDTLLEGLGNLQKRTNQIVFVGHTRIIAISEDVAREDMASIIDGLRRESTFRRQLWPIVVQGQARELLMFNPRLEQLPTLFLMDQIRTISQLGILPKLPLGDIYIAMSKTTEDPLMYYVQANEEDVRLDKLAVFNNTRMVGHLDSEEVIPLVHIRDRRRGPDVTIPVEPEKNVFVTFHPNRIGTRIQTGYENGKPSFRIRIRLDGRIIESTHKGEEKPEHLIRQVEQAAKKYYETLAKKTIDKLQHEFKADVLRLGTKFRNRHPDVWRTVDDWQEMFARADIDVTYDVRIRQTGLERR